MAGSALSSSIITRGWPNQAVAMIVVANAAISSDGITSTYNLRVDRDEYIPGLARLAKAIRQNGVIACLQLNHAGRFAKTDIKSVEK